MFRISTRLNDDAVPPAPFAGVNNFVAALAGGGDSRLALDEAGLSKYLCPILPAPEVVSAASCTASPVSARGCEAAAACYGDILAPASPRARLLRLTEFWQQTGEFLLRHYGVAGLAEVSLCPSGTDALLQAALLLAAERPGAAMTVILPAAAETGTGLPLAAACRQFDGPDAGAPLTEGVVEAVEVALRTAQAGAPRPADEVDAAYAAAVAAARGRPVVILTHGTKTGLIAPASPPAGAEVIVDACQARIAPHEVAAYLRRGWPVALTGSKFYGGPAFSGALLVPKGRFRAVPRLCREPDVDSARSLGTVLRWSAALPTMAAFAPLAGQMAELLEKSSAALAAAIGANPALVPVAGLTPRGSGWADLPSIFTFGVRDAAQPRRRLTAAELRPLYRRLAARGVLLGQPVGLGAFGGLRVAIGARDLTEGSAATSLERVFAALAEETAQSATEAV